MSEYRIGEVVDITIKGTRVVEWSGKTLVVRMPSQTGTHSFYIPDAAEVEITRAAPAEWPPQRGDLWRDRDDRLWFAVESLRSEASHGLVLLTCNGRNRRPAADIHDLYAPLTLVYREDEQDGGTER